MKVYEYKEMMRHLTRPATPKELSQATSVERQEYATGGRVKLKDGTKDPQKILPLNLESVAFRLFQDKLDNLTYNQKQTVYDYIEDRKNKKAKGGRVQLKGGSPLTDTGKDLEDTIKEDHKAFNDYRKSIGQGPIPLDNKYIQMWIRSRLKEGGRVQLKNGSKDAPYVQEIPSLGEVDPRGILQQQIINEKDPKKINELVKLLEEYDERQLEKQKVREEEKAAQKAKGVRYKEDFPSDAAYFAETGKQLLTNPKYTLGKIAKGAIEGTEFLGGQFGRSFLGIGKTDPSKSSLENLFYTPVLGEKLKINKLIEEGTPKDPTTGTLLGGEALEIGAGFLGPYEAYLLSKAAKKGVKDLKTKTATEADEKIDPARRDILKTGAVMTGGAVLYPTAKKIGMFDDLAKGIKVVRVLPEVKGMPEWFNPLITRIENEGLDITSQARKAQKLEYEKFGGAPSNAADREIVQSRKFEIPVSGKKESDIITMTEYKNGDFYVVSDTYGGAFDSPFDLYYTAPKEVTETQFLRGKDGKVYEKKVIVKKEGDFVVIEQRPYGSPRYMFDDQNIELDYMEMSLDDTISDVEKLEKIATGKKIDPKKIEQRTKNRKFVEENPMEDVVNRQGDADPDYDYGYRKFSDND